MFFEQAQRQPLPTIRSVVERGKQGSLLCERLSGHKVEIGLVPFGSIGLTLFGIDLYFARPTQSALSGLGPGLTPSGDDFDLAHPGQFESTGSQAPITACRP